MEKPVHSSLCGATVIKKRKLQTFPSLRGQKEQGINLKSSDSRSLRSKLYSPAISSLREHWFSWIFGNSVNCMIERESCVKLLTVTEWEVNEVHLTDQWCKPVIRWLVQIPDGLSRAGNLNRYLAFCHWINKASRYSFSVAG